MGVILLGWGQMWMHLHLHVQKYKNNNKWREASLLAITAARQHFDTQAGLEASWLAMERVLPAAAFLNLMCL